MTTTNASHLRLHQPIRPADVDRLDEALSQQVQELYDYFGALEARLAEAGIARSTVVPVCPHGAAQDSRLIQMPGGASVLICAACAGACRQYAAMFQERRGG